MPNVNREQVEAHFADLDLKFRHSLLPVLIQLDWQAMQVEQSMRGDPPQPTSDQGAQDEREQPQPASAQSVLEDLNAMLETEQPQDQGDQLQDHDHSGDDSWEFGNREDRNRVKNLRRGQNQESSNYTDQHRSGRRRSSGNPKDFLALQQDLRALQDQERERSRTKPASPVSAPTLAQEEVESVLEDLNAMLETEQPQPASAQSVLEDLEDELPKRYHRELHLSQALQVVDEFLSLPHEEDRLAVLNAAMQMPMRPSLRERSRKRLRGNPSQRLSPLNRRMMDVSDAHPAWSKFMDSVA